MSLYHHAAELNQKAEKLTREYAELSKAFYIPTAGDIVKPKPTRTKQPTENKNVLTNKLGGSIISSVSISGARNPYGEKAKVHSEKYYGLVRTMKTDISKIAKSTGFSEKQIQEVKNFIFYEKHDLGGNEPELFAPDFMMAETWRRLIDGKPEAHDITLIKHEIMECDLMKKGYTQAEAHIITSKKYNYDKEAKMFYDKIKKYSD